MKMKYIFSLAALALMTAACSSDENTQPQSAPSGKTLPFRAVITAGTPVTRGLTEGDKTISAAWVKDEEVALVYGTSYDIMTVESVDDNGVATITGTVSGSPQDGDDVVVVYCGTGTTLETLEQDIKGAADDEAVFAVVTGSDLFKSQSGTFAGINSALDLRISSGAKFAVSNGSATLSETTKLTERFAIWKLGLTDGTDDISADELTVEYGTSSITAKPSEAASTIYLAVEPTSEIDFSFTAKVSEDEYTYSAEKVTLAAGKFYTSTLTMTEVNNKYLVYDSSGKATATDIPSDATAITSTTTTWAKGTYVVSEDVTIAGDVTLSGDVNLILMDGVTLTVNGAILGGGPSEANYEDYSLSIFAQSTGDDAGKLIVNNAQNTTSTGVLHVKNLNIHGGNIDVSGTKVIQGIETGGTLTIFNGIVNAIGTLNGIIPLGSMYVYGGEITAKSTESTGRGIRLPVGETTLTISGGKVTATATGDDECFAIEATYAIVITGGEVVANGDLYGIFVSNEENSNGKLIISGGSVTANGGISGGAGICVDNYAFSGSSTVINATGGSSAEGIIAYYNSSTISGGTINAFGGSGGGIGLEGNVTISGGIVTAIGGDGEENGFKNGGAGIDGALTVNGGTVTATGGAGDGDGSDGLGISDGTTITLGSNIKLYEGDSANPTSEAVDQAACTKRYAIIK